MSHDSHAVGCVYTHTHTHVQELRYRARDIQEAKRDAALASMKKKQVKSGVSTTPEGGSDGALRGQGRQLHLNPLSMDGNSSSATGGGDVSHGIPLRERYHLYAQQQGLGGWGWGTGRTRSWREIGSVAARRMLYFCTWGIVNKRTLDVVLDLPSPPAPSLSQQTRASRRAR